MLRLLVQTDPRSKILKREAEKSAEQQKIGRRRTKHVDSPKPYLLFGRAPYPLTYSGVQTAWRRLRKRAGVEGFRFHDYRHNLGTKLLRETGNVKIAQRALNHLY